MDKGISKSDALALLEIAHASLSCSTIEPYKKLVEGLNNLLPFDFYISGLVDTRHISYDSLVVNSFNMGYPRGYYESYLNRNYHLIDPLYQRFYNTFDVQNSMELKALYKTGLASAISRLRYEFGINNIFLYGIHELNPDAYTILSISGRQIENNRRSRAIIKYMLPFLSISIKHLIPLPQTTDIAPPTPNELEVLNWLKEGKSSWEISVILNKSERTINFHIDNILKKLHAKNRTHAVAKALENHLLDMG